MVTYLTDHYGSVKELATIFQCSERTIRTRITEMRASGRYQGAIFKGAGSMKICVEEFQKYLKERGRGNG